MQNTNSDHQAIYKKEIYDGLTAFPKRLSSKYFYDENGDLIFQKIMEMPDYYLTNCEFEILSNYKEKLSKIFIENTPKGLDLIELGAGDGKKTKILLNYMVDENYDFVYKPIDISANALRLLKQDLLHEIPNLKVETEVGEYFEVLSDLKNYNRRKKVILILGSNIGNLLHPKAIEFLTKLKLSMNDSDLLFMGFDQKKNPQTILNAYNDQSGITEAFNKNILVRINRELDADFDPNKFIHWPTYNPETGTTKSFLVAKEKMEVRIKALDLQIHFHQWESIHTEISQKYDDAVVSWLAEQSGLKIIDAYTDSREYYKDYLFRKL